MRLADLDLSQKTLFSFLNKNLFPKLENVKSFVGVETVLPNYSFLSFFPDFDFENLDFINSLFRKYETHPAQVEQFISQFFKNSNQELKNKFLTRLLEQARNSDRFSVDNDLLLYHLIISYPETMLSHMNFDKLFIFRQSYRIGSFLLDRYRFEHLTNDPEKLEKYMIELCKYPFGAGVWQKKILTLFLEHGAKLLHVDERGNPLLNSLIAVEHECINLDLIEFVIQKGIEINYKDSFGQTAVFTFCKNYQLDYTNPKTLKEKLIPLLLILINNGANVNEHDNEGMTPLEALIIKHDRKLLIEPFVKILLENGANLQTKTVSDKEITLYDLIMKTDFSDEIKNLASSCQILNFKKFSC